MWKSTSELGYRIASMVWGARNLISTQAGAAGVLEAVDAGARAALLLGTPRAKSCRENPRRDTRRMLIYCAIITSTRRRNNLCVLSSQKVTGNSMETAGISRVAGAAWRVSQQRHADLGLADAPPLRLALIH